MCDALQLTAAEARAPTLAVVELAIKLAIDRLRPA